MSDETLSITLNPQARISLKRMGREGNPLLIIDDALAEPRLLAEAALTAAFTAPHHTQYPGLNAPLPDAYHRVVIAALRPYLQRGFGVPAELPLTYFGFFALATAAPEALKPIQKIPHTDSPDPFRIAMVHYLCGSEQGGTGFFRHRTTGFEAVDMRRREAFVAASAAELEAGGDSLTRHVHADTPNFELIEAVQAQFNRLIVYRSNVLHSGLLETSNFSADPSAGRLTANSFLEVARPG